jgi:nicotinamidase-related amidase
MDLHIPFPLSISPVSLSKTQPVGLVIVDAGVAFTRQGLLSDPTHMIPMVKRIGEHYRNLKEALGERLHVLCFLDTHHPDIPEPPYPPHGIIGTGEELMDPDLEWLLQEPQVTVVRKDCINGFVGGIDRESGQNAVVEWMRETGVRQLLVTGDCTDICVSDFVVTMLSARNHGLFTRATEREAQVEAIVGLQIVVLVDACETYDAPWHSRGPAHHVGLWFMLTRGAVLASEWNVG